MSPNSLSELSNLNKSTFHNVKKLEESEENVARLKDSLRKNNRKTIESDLKLPAAISDSKMSLAGLGLSTIKDAKSKSKRLFTLKIN